jgi:hypothetical protein
MAAEETNFHLEGQLTAEKLKRLILDQLVPAVTELLKPHLQRLEFQACEAIPQDGTWFAWTVANREDYKLQRELDIVLKGETLDG